MRYLQSNKFSYILIRLFKVNRDELLTNGQQYDKFLKATLCDCFLSFLFLIISINFLLSILTFIQNTTQIIHDSRNDQTFKYIYDRFNTSRPDYSNLKHLYSHSRVDSHQTVNNFYSKHKFDKINCVKLDSKTSKCSVNCCFLLVLKNELKSDQILTVNQLNITKLAHSKTTIINIVYLNKNLKFISNLQAIHEFGPNDVIFSKFKFTSLKTSNLNYKLNLFCFVISCVFSLYFIVDELFKIIVYKFEYFCIMVNLADLILVCLVSSFILIHLIVLVYAGSFQSGFILYKMYIQMTHLIDYQTKQLNLSIIMVLFSWFKLYKFINFTNGITQMNATLSLAFPDLFSFLVAFLLILTGFSTLLNRIFGSISSDLNSILKSQFSLLKFLIGLPGFKRLFDYNSNTARIIFFTYFIFVFIIFLNIFLAIINTCYSHILRTYTNKPELDYFDFFKKRFIFLKDYYHRKKTIDKSTLVEEKQSPRLSLVDTNEINESITASKFRVYLLNNIKRIENADIDVIYRMNNIRENGLKRFTDAFEKIYGDLDKELDLDSEIETVLTPEQCREIVIKLNLAKKRISFLKNSHYLRKKSFFKPVFNQQENGEDNKCQSSLSVLSSMSSIRSKFSANSKLDQKSDQASNLNINHELYFKEFDNVHTELVSWKEFVNLKKSLNHLQNEISCISNNFLSELK